jgi:hypothetical protein
MHCPVDFTPPELLYSGSILSWKEGLERIKKKNKYKKEKKINNTKKKYTNKKKKKKHTNRTLLRALKS